VLSLEEFRALGLPFLSYQENIDTGSPLGQAIFVIVAAVAQLERDLIVERVNARIRNARASGKRLGRPRQHVNLERMLELQAAGMSLRKIAVSLKVGYGTIRERLQSSERKSLRTIAQENGSITSDSAAQ